MNPQFSQAGGSVSKDVNKQSIARSLGVKVGDVVYLKQGITLQDYKAYFDKSSQLVFLKTPDVTGTLVSWSVDVASLTLTLTTSNNVYNLFIAPNSLTTKKTLTFDMFYIDKSGNTDVTSKIKSVFDIANKFKLPVTQNDGLYLISGSFTIICNYGFNLSGCTLKLASNTTGQFKISQPAGPTTYSAGSPLLNMINAASGTDLIAGNGLLTSLKNDTTLNNTFCFFTGVDDLFQYTGNASPSKWKHNCAVYHYGLLAIPFKYGVSALESIYSLPIAKQVTEVHLPNVDLQNNPHNILFAFDGITRYRIHEGGTVNKPLKQVGPFYLCSLTNYMYVEQYALSDPYPTASFSDVNMTQQTASYTLNYGRGSDLTVYNSNCQGYGWGATGGGDIIANTTFINCNFNRYDSHNPVIGYFKIIDSTFGVGGVAVAGWGDVHLERPVWNMNPRVNDPYGSNTPMFIRIRETHGGWYDGDLYIKDAVINGWTDTAPNFIDAPQNSDTSLPAGSPISPYAFRNVYVDGLTFTKPTVGKKLSKFHSLTGSLSSALYAPEHIVINRLNYNCYGSANPEDDALVFDFSNVKQNPNNTTANHTAIEPASTRISISESRLQALVFKRGAIAANHNIDVTLDGVTPATPYSDFVSLYTNLKGTYTIKNSKIYRISDSVSGGAIATAIVVKMEGGMMKQGGTSDLPIVTAGAYAHDISFSDVTFVGNYSHTAVTAQNQNLAQWGSLNNCNYYNQSGGIVPHLMLWSGSIGTSETAIGASVHDGNTLITALNINSIVTYDMYRVVNVTGPVGRYIYNPSTAGYYLNLSRNGHRVTIVSGYGSASIRELHVK